MKKYLVIGLLAYWFIGLFLPKANASTTQNNNYTLEKQNVEIQPFKKPTPTPKAEKKPFASGKNYTVEANTTSFNFSISHDVLNFGTLTATNPVLRLLYLTTISQVPYQILTIQNHPLSDGDKIIPDTTCDNGSCTDETSSSWTSALTYGFGYQTSNMTEDEYKQFPDLSKNEEPTVIFYGNNGNHQEKIVYKANTSTTQQPGSYSNVITYIATPSF